MYVLRLQFVAVACVGIVSPAFSAPARFWISTACLPGTANCTNPINPATDLVNINAPTINAAIGRERTLYIWAQPAAGTSLQNVSLNLVIPDHVASTPVIDFLDPTVDFPDPTIKVYSPIVGGQPRFQHWVDSTGSPPIFQTVASNATDAEVQLGEVDGIGGREFGLPRGGYDIQGLSVNCGGCVGIGSANDPLSAMTSSGRAWLFASVSLQPMFSTGSNDYYLQIGYAGITQLVGQTASPAQAVFGSDPSQMLYDSGVCNSVNCDRQLTRPTDSYDVRLVATAAQAGDFDGDGVIGAGDYTFWRSRFGQTVTAGSTADGNSNGIVDGADYILWRNVTGPGSGAGAVPGSPDFYRVPEPSAGTLALALLIRLLLSRRSCC